MQADASPLIVGSVSGVYGVRGWVKVFSFTRPKENLLNYRHWLIERDGDWRDARMLQAKAHGRGFVASFDEIGDREQAKELVGCRLAVNRSELPPTEDDEYYWSDLESLAVFDSHGDCLGHVDRLLETGAHDVLVVVSDQGEILIPFVPGKTVSDVSLTDGRITVDWKWR